MTLQRVCDYAPFAPLFSPQTDFNQQMYNYSLNDMKEPQNKNNELFEKFVMPRLNWIKGLVVCFSAYQSEINDNYNITLTAIWRGIHTYNPEIDFDKWGYIVIKNCVLRLNKMHYKYQNHFSGMDYNQDKTYIDYNPDLFFYADDKLYNAICKITTKRQKIFVLRCNGYKIKDIAKTLNINETAVKNGLFAIRKLIKSSIMV